MIFDINLANNPHRYNLPNVNEVAAVFVGDDITGIPKRRIKVFLNQTEGGFRTRGMSALEGACDPPSTLCFSRLEGPAMTNR
jgi:hypothetical protein